jgi:hypothetical protein
MSFLGHVVGENGISMEQEKVKAIQEWPVPSGVPALRSFLGLAGYYRRFVKDFSKIAAPLTDLLRSELKWQWSTSQETAFRTLQTAISSAPVLIVPDPSLPYEVMTDASGFAVGATLSQDQGKGLQPVAYLSHKMNEHERKYPVHEQELLAVITALKEWRHYLHGLRFHIITDHQSLRYLSTQPHLSPRQVRWSEFLQQFDYTLDYKPGKLNVAADALSRREDLNIALPRPTTAALQLQAISESTLSFSPDLASQIKTAYQTDAATRSILADPRSHSSHHRIQDGLIYCGQQLYIPAADSIKAALLREAHDSAVGGHVGITKTQELVSRSYYWPKMAQDVKEYVNSCPTCLAIKARNDSPAGLLHSIPHPPRRWQQISMDLITSLPRTASGLDAIFVVVDKCSKMIHCLPTTTTCSAPELARLFWREVVRHHGVPTSIISDRDPRFTSSFWTELWKRLGTKLAMSTSYHPQTDGQTERANRSIEDILRAYVSSRQNDWDQHLTAVEIAYNNSRQASTGFSPFFLNSGQHPAYPFSLAIPQTNNEPSNAAVETMLENLAADLVQAEENVKKAQSSQERHSNKHRIDRQFQVGEQVWLSTDDLRLRMKVTPKLTQRWIGPFPIQRKLSPLNYELALPPTLRIHPVFHVSKLRLHKQSARFDTHRPPPPARPPPEIADQAEQYEVEAIRDHRERKYGRRMYKQYLVKWKDYPEWENTWEWEDTLHDRASDAVRSYWTLQGQQSGLQQE